MQVSDIGLARLVIDIMVHEFRQKCPIESKRLLLLIGLSFALVLTFQYFELPYGNVLFSLFSGGKSQPTESVSVDNSSPPPEFAKLNSTKISNMTEQVSLDSKDDFVSDPNGDSDDVLESDEISNPKNQSLFENFGVMGENTTEKQENSSTILFNNDRNRELQNVTRAEEIYLSVDSDRKMPVPSAPETAPHVSSLPIQDSNNSIQGNKGQGKTQQNVPVITLSQMNKMLVESRASMHSKVHNRFHLTFATELFFIFTFCFMRVLCLKFSALVYRNRCGL